MPHSRKTDCIASDFQFRKQDHDLEVLDFGPNSGTFWSILALVAKHDQIVARKIRNGPGNAKYTHRTVQNALMSIMAEMVLQEIAAAEVASAQYFSLLADESKNLSKKGAVISSNSMFVQWLGL
jgi:hypothetical protein